MAYEKVFGVGLNKTGTTTLGDMLGQFGLRHRDWKPSTFQLFQQGKMNRLLRQTDRYDSFTDWPWPLMVPKLLDHFGDRALFILTRRASPRVWVESLKGHALATKPGNNARQAVYGYEYPHENEGAHLRFYSDHLDATRQLFLDRGCEYQLLELCWEEGDGWNEVAQFLARPAPTNVLPHHNSRKTRRKFLPYKAENLARIGSLVAQSTSSNQIA